MESSIAKLELADRMLAEAQDLHDISQIRDIAVAAQAYAKAAMLGVETTNKAALVKIKAERKAGEYLKQLDRASYDRGNQHVAKFHSGTQPSDYAQTLEEVQIPKTTAYRWQKMADVPEPVFAEHVERVTQEKDELTSAGVLRLAKAKKRADKKAARQSEKELAIREMAQTDIGDFCDIRHCSMAELFASGIEPDCIITDPPYPKEYLPLYEELARLAVNVPLVAVMCGQSYLPEIYAAMSKHLEYRWTLAYLTPGGQAVQQWPRKVNTFWKPILLFGQAVDWIGDVAKSNTNDNDKRFHHWGQSESGMVDLVERLSKPGQLVCDPFAGGGTTAVVSLQLGRRFVGCDIDKESVLKSMDRCREVHNATS